MKIITNIIAIILIGMSLLWLFIDLNNVPNVSDWLAFVIIEAGFQTLFHNLTQN